MIYLEAYFDRTLTADDVRDTLRRLSNEFEVSVKVCEDGGGFSGVFENPLEGAAVIFDQQDSVSIRISSPLILDMCFDRTQPTIQQERAQLSADISMDTDEQRMVRFFEMIIQALSPSFAMLCLDKAYRKIHQIRYATPIGMAERIVGNTMGSGVLPGIYWMTYISDTLVHQYALQLNQLKKTEYRAFHKGCVITLGGKSVSASTSYLSFRRAASIIRRLAPDRFFNKESYV